MRLNRFLAECGVDSRRKCDHLILQGRVSVNDVVEQRLGVKIDETSDRVKINGKLLKRPERLEYIVLNKPKGYVSTTSDERARKTVCDLVRGHNRLFPVGRLDIDTTGLLLLTNDGDLAYQLSHPKFNAPKIYRVILGSSLKQSDKSKLETGIHLQEGRTSPCKIDFPSPTDKRLVHVTLHQGWNRQVRRMFAKVGYEVTELRRIGIASVRLDSLELGSWRHLTAEEVDRLRKGAF